METIVFLDRASIQAEIRRPAFPHAWVEYPGTDEDQLVARLADATIAISNKAALRAPTLAQLPRLKLIAIAATGTNNIDLDYCRAHAIAVTNIRDYAVHAVPEHAFMLMLALRRNLLAYRADVARGMWQRADQFCLLTHPVEDLHGATLGIVGFGALGRACARLGAAFGMRVAIAERRRATAVRPGYTAFEEMLRAADVVSLHCPLTEATRYLIGARELATMKPGAILINTARGGLVDEDALAKALRAGRIGGAGFDVLSEEPPRHGNPLLDLNLPNFILTPHVGWTSRSAMQMLADQLIEVIEAHVADEARNRVV